MWAAKARLDTTASDDRADGNLLRTQTAAAGIAVNAQRRGDETKISPCSVETCWCGR
jgi:hypothetical protein